MQAHGDCNVLHGSAEDPRLAKRVGRQWVGKRKLDRGGPGEMMAAARVAKLDKLGFEWDRSRIGGAPNDVA